MDVGTADLRAITSDHSTGKALPVYKISCKNCKSAELVSVIDQVMEVLYVLWEVLVEQNESSAYSLRAIGWVKPRVASPLHFASS